MHKLFPTITSHRPSPINYDKITSDYCVLQYIWFPETFQRDWKLFRVHRIFLECPKTFQIVWKVFQRVQKLSRVYRIFQGVCKLSGVSWNFPKAPETSKSIRKFSKFANFRLIFLRSSAKKIGLLKLSIKQCLNVLEVFLTLALLALSLSEPIC